MTTIQEEFISSYIELQKFSFCKQNICCNKSYGGQYYVYFLVNPINDKIFYIGKGKGKRADGHLRENKSGKISNSKKHSVISEIIENGLLPEIFIFENELSEKEAFDIERKLIVRLNKFISNSSSGRKNKEEENIEWAKSILRKMMDSDQWIALGQKEEHVIIHKEIVDFLEKVASGELLIHNTVSIRDGKMILS